MKAMYFMAIAMVFGILPAFSPSSISAEEKAKSDDSDAKVGTGPWISHVRWLDDQVLVGAQSQGLLLRPGQVVKTTTADPSKLETIGEQETSIWSVLPAGAGNVIASNYKGEIFLHGKGEPKKFESTTRWVRCLAESPAFGELLAGTEDGKLVVLSLADAKEARRVDAHAAAIFDIAISPQRDKVATAAGDGSIKIWSWPKLDAIATMSRGNEAVWAVLFSTDGSRLISGGADRRIQLWNVDKAKLVMSLKVAPDWVTSLTAIPNSSLIVAGCMNGKLEVVDYQSLLPVAETEAASSGVWSVACSPNGEYIAVGTRKHGLKLVKADQWHAAAKAVAERASSERPPAPTVSRSATAKAATVSASSEQPPAPTPKK